MKQMLFLLSFTPALLLAQQKNSSTINTITNSNFKIVQDSIEEKIQRGVIPSFSVAVSQKGTVIWQQSFGWADKERKIKATPATPYAIASLSKSITATAVMVLAEKGLVHWNDPVDRYLENTKLTYYKGAPAQLTIGHVLNMTGGIPHQWTYQYTNDKNPLPTLHEQIKQYGIVVFAPGTVFQYSNFSPALAEQIIQTVTGTDLARFMHESLFTPLHMQHALVNRKEATKPAVAKGYDFNGHPVAESEFYPKGGAGYYASVSDLVRYGMFHLKNKKLYQQQVLNDSSIDRLHQPETTTPFNAFYANGWGVLNLDAKMKSLLSNGAIDGAASSLLLLTDQDIAIACVTNATVGNDFTDQMAFTIANVLEPGYLDALQKFIDSNAAAFSDKPFQADTLAGTWEGKIITTRDTIPVQVVIDTSSRVFVHIQNQYETVLNNVTTANGLINGQCFGHLPLPQAGDMQQELLFALKPEHDILYGSISAQSAFTQRPYFLIPAFISLQRKFLK